MNNYNVIPYSIHNKPFIIQKPKISTVYTCDYCGKKLPEATDIRLYNKRNSIVLKGKLCVDCDSIYVSDNTPDKILDKLKYKFSNNIEIYKSERMQI